MDTLEELKEAARAAIERVFSFSGVLPADTIAAMEEIADIAETNIAALRCDLEKANDE